MEVYWEMFVLAGTPKGMYFEMHLINYRVYCEKQKGFERQFHNCVSTDDLHKNKTATLLTPYVSTPNYEQVFVPRKLTTTSLYGESWSKKKVCSMQEKFPVLKYRGKEESAY